MARLPPIPRQRLLHAAEQLLSGLSARGLVSRGKANDAFEFWLWAMTVEAAHTKHGPGTVSFLQLRGGKVSLRTSPSDRDRGNYTYAVLHGQHGAVELHTGIYVAGISTSRQELDVVALEHPLIATPPRSRVEHLDVQWAMEAKLYTTVKRLPLSIPRAVLGSAYDLGALGGYRVKSAAAAPYRKRFNGPWMALASSARLSADGDRLLGPRSRSTPVIGVAQGITSVTATQDVRAFIDRHVDRV